MIALTEPGLLGFKRHVFLAVQLDVHAGVPVKNFVAVLRQFAARGMLQVNLFELELARLERRFDALDEVQVGFLGVRIVGVTGHGDVSLGPFFIEHGAELAPVQQPALEFVSGGALWRAGFQLVEQRLDLRPIT